MVKSDLESQQGRELLDHLIRIAMDGKLTPLEVKELRSWLKVNRHNSEINGVVYLADIMDRITADKVVYRDELMELQLAIERVIPATHRPPIEKARKKRFALIREQQREARQMEKAKQDEELRRLRAEEQANHAERIRKEKRLRHRFGKVAGVGYKNEDGTERQDIIASVAIGESLYFEPEPSNPFSPNAIKILRSTKEQIGYVPEYLAEIITREIEDGYFALGLTLGDYEIPTGSHEQIGLTYAVFFLDGDVTQEEVDRYVVQVIKEAGKG